MNTKEIREWAKYDNGVSIPAYDRVNALCDEVDWQAKEIRRLRKTCKTLGKGALAMEQHIANYEAIIVNLKARSETEEKDDERS